MSTPTPTTPSEDTGEEDPLRKLIMAGKKLGQSCNSYSTAGRAFDMSKTQCLDAHDTYIESALSIILDSGIVTSVLTKHTVAISTIVSRINNRLRRVKQIKSNSIDNRYVRRELNTLNSNLEALESALDPALNDFQVLLEALKEVRKNLIPVDR